MADLVMIAALMALGLSMRGQDHPGFKLGCFFGVLALNLVIRHRKGEPRSWG